jgi:hypothetical protein
MSELLENTLTEQKTNKVESQDTSKTQDTKKTEKPDVVYKAADMVFAFVMLVCGYLYWDLILSNWPSGWDHISSQPRPGAGITIFTIFICVSSFVYLLKSGYKQNLKSWLCLGVVMLSSLQFSLFDNWFLFTWNFLFLMCAFVYWICLSTSRQIDKDKISAYFVGDVVNQGLCVPFNNFARCFVGVKKSFLSHKNEKSMKGIFAGIVGLLLALPFILIVIGLLMDADFAFEAFVTNFMNKINLLEIMRHAFTFIVGIPVAFYLYGLIFGNVKGRKTEAITKQSVDSAANTAKIAPKATIYCIMFAFNIIYLIFFIVQAGYLFSAMSGNLPEGLTYAEYARRGFFELCRVAGINLAILAVSHLFIKREACEESKILKGLTVTLSMFTMLLIVTALSKMFMYINIFGLTQLRVYTSWFMILLFIIFTIICIRQFKKFNSAKAMIISFVIMFMVLAYSNVDGNIARYNIERYERGTLQSLDIESLTVLSRAAHMQVFDLYLRTEDEELKERLEWFIVFRVSRWISDDFRDFNLQTHRGRTINEYVWRISDQERDRIMHQYPAHTRR